MRAQEFFCQAPAALALLAFWQAAKFVFLADPLFLPSPSRMGSETIEIFRTPSAWNDLETIVVEFVIGYVLTILVFAQFELLTGCNRRLNVFLRAW
jgi:ABC-type nitrate/sulfonate/bicarbonate transport system permease component